MSRTKQTTASDFRSLLNTPEESNTHGQKALKAPEEYEPSVMEKAVARYLILPFRARTRVML
jgi:hypothetical protein